MQPAERGELASDAAGAPDPAAFRQVVGRFATGVTVVSLVDAGARYGLTVNSFASVSLDPLLVLFCCEHDAVLHEPLLRAGTWAVSMLSAEQQDVSATFAARPVPGTDQFATRTWRPGARTGAPLLDGALAWLECRTWATYDGGDHTIVVGEVLGLGLGLEPGADARPLLYFRSEYRTTD